MHANSPPSQVVMPRRPDRHTRRNLLVALGGGAALLSSSPEAIAGTKGRKKRRRGKSCGNGMCVDPASR